MQDYRWDGVKRDRLVWIGDMHPEVATINAVFGFNDVVPCSLDLTRDVTPVTAWMNGISSYAALRRPETLAAAFPDEPRVVPLRLEVTDLESVAAAVSGAPAISLLGNNAATLAKGDLLANDALECSTAPGSRMSRTGRGHPRVRAHAPPPVHRGGRADQLHRCFVSVCR